MDSLNLPFGLLVLNDKPADAKYYNRAGTPYTSTAQVLSEILDGARYPGLTVVVGTGVSAKEYWWKLIGGTSDGELIVKTDSSTLAGTGGAALVGFNPTSPLASTTVQGAINEVLARFIPIGSLSFADKIESIGLYGVGWTDVTSDYANRTISGYSGTLPNYLTSPLQLGDSLITVDNLPSISFTGTASGTVTVSNHNHSASGGGYSLKMPDHTHEERWGGAGSTTIGLNTTVLINGGDNAGNYFVTGVIGGSTLEILGETALSQPSGLFSDGSSSGTSTGTNNDPYFPASIGVRVFRRTS